MKTDFSTLIHGLMENKELGNYGRHEILWFVMYYAKFERN